MAAASINFNFSFATRPFTSTRSSSPLLIAVLFNKTSLAGGFSLRGHFYPVREGTLSNSFNMILFAVMEPEEGDAHNVFVDGTLMSPGSEDYTLSPASELVDPFRRFLGNQVQVSEGA
jgi:hypothetical protein